MINDYIYHHGIKGQRWGVRRYQNADGTLTAAGRKRQSKEDGSVKNERGFDKRKIAKYVAAGSALAISSAAVAVAVSKGKNLLMAC